MFSKRVQHSSSSISYPINSELAPCFSSPELLASPPTTPPPGHKHSLSKQMAWLNRSSSTSNHSVPQAAPKPMRISEPKVGSSLEQFNFQRGGLLGSGAVIVRTPQEALASSLHVFGQPLIKEEEGSNGNLLSNNAEENEHGHLPPNPPSLPLPPLPNISDAGDRLSGGPSVTSVLLSDNIPRPGLSGSPAAHVSSPRPTLLEHSRAPSRSMPAPADAELTPPQPPFEAILLSSIPDGATDPSKLIIALETCTTTYRTSLRTLVSRPSHLSRYLMSLLSPVSETASVYSNASDASSFQHSNGFSSLFRDHLASSGCLPPSTTIHIFLDRPSAPYAHVLSYLRSLPGTPEHPEAVLPRAVQLGSMSPCRFEFLLELRDEASYLGLAELYKLCCQELDRFPRPRLMSTSGVSTPHGKTGSVHSFRTVVEQGQQPHSEVRPSEGQAPKGNGNVHADKSATRKSNSSSLGDNKDALARERGGPKKGIKYGLGSPPPGWI